VSEWTGVKEMRLAGPDYGGSLLVRLQIDDTRSERLGEEGYPVTVAANSATIVAAADFRRVPHLPPAAGECVVPCIALSAAIAKRGSE